MNSIWISIFTIGILELIFGIILEYASHLFKTENDLIIAKIDTLLPQSQCGQCGYLGCLSYARAISTKDERINLCLPGGREVTKKIAELFNVEIPAINDCEIVQEPIHMIAIINESNCIGCSKCIRVCPVDAIIGTIGAIHTVLVDLCTGCNLCIEPCPTQCIKLHTVITIVGDRQMDSYTVQADLDTISIRTISMEINA